MGFGEQTEDRDLENTAPFIVIAGKCDGDFGYWVTRRRDTAQRLTRVYPDDTLGCAQAHRAADRLNAEHRVGLKHRDAVRLELPPARGAGYSADRIAFELNATASGSAYFGNALRVAKDIPGLGDDDLALLDRWATGRQTASDSFRLQDLAIWVLKSDDPAPAAPAAPGWWDDDEPAVDPAVRARLDPQVSDWHAAAAADLLAEEQAEEQGEQLAVTVRVGKLSVTRVALLYSSQQRRGRGVEDALDNLFESAMHELIDDEVI